MTYTVKTFLIYHRYLAKIFIEVGLLEGSYSHVLDTVGEYYVNDYCRCGDPVCATVEMKNNKRKGRNETFAFGFNIGWIIFSYYGLDSLDVESLADDVEKFDFPFRAEIRKIFDGEKLDYDDVYAELVVEIFMKKLKRCTVKTIEV